MKNVYIHYTVSEGSGRYEGTGDGTEGPFSPTYLIYDEEHILVYVDSVLQTLTSDYTVSGIGDPPTPGFDVTFQAGSYPDADADVTIIRDPPQEQQIDFATTGALAADDVEKGLDLNVMLVQNLNETYERALTAPIADASSIDLELPGSATRAGQVFLWDSGSEPSVTDDNTDGSFLVADGSGWVVEAGATARTSMGVGTGDSPQFTGLTLTGALTVAGATALNGNTTIGNASGDTLDFHPAAWTLNNAVSITGTWTDLGIVTTVDINGGTIDGAVIGGASAAAGSFTTLDTSGAVGIGTSSPDGTLHVHTASAGAVSADNNADELVLENSGAAGLTILSPNTQTNAIWFGDEDDSAVAGFVYNHSDNSFKIYAANGLFATIDSSRNVGIGVTPESGISSSYSNVSIGGTGAISALTSQSAGADMEVSQNVYYAGSSVWKYIVADEASNYRQTSGKHSFYVAGAGTADAAINWKNPWSTTLSGAAGSETITQVFKTFSAGSEFTVLTLAADGGVVMTQLPTSDPGVAGELWIDTTADRVVKASAG